MKPQSVGELKQRVYQTIEIGNRSDTLSHSFDIFLTVNIILNILVMILQTFEELRQFFPLFNAIEIFTLCVFLIEYALRIWTATCRYPDKPPLQAALAFIFSWDGLIELFTILPFFFLSGFVAFRMLRVVRVFHLFRINATTDSFHVITSVLYEKRNQIASSIFIIFVLMLASSLCMYSAEHTAQPGAFRNALSGIWWSMSAILTVGYGDIYPITTAGRILGIIISFLGVCVVAIPTGIISAGFVEQARKAEIDPSSLESHISSVLIDVDSLWKEKTVREVEQLTGLKLVVLNRNDVVILPKPDMVLQLKDRILTLEETDLDHSDSLQA
jgi:voltage-gated potassium channel